MIRPIRVFRILQNLARRRIGLDPVHGTSLSHDLRRLAPGFRARMIFDVGANKGQTAVEFLSAFPGATIHSFEPVLSTFRQLVENTRTKTAVKCHHIAFGSTRGAGWMAAHQKSELSHLVDDRPEVTDSGPTSYESVEVDTVHSFCLNRGIERIDLLKLDTEGHDMEVLLGAESMLAAQVIDVIQVEAGISRSNTRHVPLERFQEYLDTHSYLLFGFYDQTHEWPTMKPNLRRVNAVFISSQLCDASETA